MSVVEQIAQQALALAPEDRVFLANVLEQSLTTGDFATAELAEAWTAEIDRRLRAHEQGETHATDADAALERIGQRLDQHRARKAAP